MIMPARLLCLLLFVSVCSYSQTIVVSPASLRFDTLLVNTKDSLSFRILNNSTDTLKVTDINTNKPAFVVRDTAFVVLPHDSTKVWVYFQTNQNITWDDVVLIENRGARGTLPVRVSGTAKYAGTAYSTTQGLRENDLKTALFNLVNNQTVLGYNTARDRMYETVDDPLNNDTLECVYTGRKIFAHNRTEAQALNFNAEHTWPQSNFGSADPMVSDLNHLYPTDATANSMRANYPFGPAVSNVTWQVGGSKLGRNPNGQTVFEPRDIHKGDVARALFYFLLRYPVNYGGFMDANQEFYLRQWYSTDPVSQKEILRNNAIATYQGKRNPLIDHPEFIDRITYFRVSTAPTLQPDIVASPVSVQFSSVAFGDSSEWKLTIVNRGRAQLSISSIALQSSSASFALLDAPTQVPVDSFRQVRIKFKPDQPNLTYSNTIVIQSNDPNRPSVTVPLSGSSAGPASVVNPAVPTVTGLSQNYPNPFNPSTTVSFALQHSSFASLKVFDVLGKEVTTLADERLEAGQHNIVWNATGVASGVYVCRLSVEGSIYSKRMILIR
ncbi:MAG: endonuclease [bacterium]